MSRRKLICMLNNQQMQSCWHTIWAELKIHYLENLK